MTGLKLCALALGVATAGVLFSAPVAAQLDAGDSLQVTPRPLIGWPLLELRTGMQGVPGAGNAVICAEVGVWEYIALESCGTGADFFYEGDDGAEMSHYRIESIIPVWGKRDKQLVVQAGFGFAEIEKGGDAGGFLFGAARNEDQTEGAGPEGSVYAKFRMWPHERYYLSAEVGGGAAYIPSAPVVLDQSNAWVPFFGATVGVGF